MKLIETIWKDNESKIVFKNRLLYCEEKWIDIL